MLKHDDAAKGIDIEITLTDTERSILASHVKQQGFDILQKLMEDQVRKFNLKLINTPVSKPEEVIANHALAKGVTQFYAGLVDRLNHELDIDIYGTRESNIKNPENTMSIEELA